MVKLLVALAVVLQTAQPPQAPPDTEIFLAPLTMADGRIVVGTPVNITSSPGYDNQPSFTPDGRSILFSSARSSGSAPPAGQPAGALPATDIYRYDVAAKQVRRVTTTAEPEFSPTSTPDGRHISVIRVEPDGTQRLWRFTTDGKDPQLVLADIKPVGYHAWIDDHTLALFVLGSNGAPATLQVADTKSGKAQIVATGIGRSLQRVPKGGISFVQREPAKEGTAPALTVKHLRAANATPTTIVPVITGATEADLAWTPDGTLIMAHAGKLYALASGATEWAAIANLDELGLRAASRLAISPRGNLIAIVAQPK